MQQTQPYHSQAALETLQAFQSEIKVSNQGCSNELHDKLMSKLFYEILTDFEVSSRDEEPTFKVDLWTSGVLQKNPNRSVEAPASSKPEAAPRIER